jgi:hypothetical protein
MGEVRSARLSKASLVALLCLCATLFLFAARAQAAGPPQIEGIWATGVTATAANLHAGVDPDGLDTTYRFEYITAVRFQENLGAQPPREGFFGAVKAPPGAAEDIGSGTVGVEVSQHIGGLEASTAYRYRITATNSAEVNVSPAHTLTTEETTPVFALPDNRGWEMVSPVDKGSGQIGGPGENHGGDVLQASADGNAVTYSSASSFAGGTGAPAASQYLSRREAGSWSTENISAPLFSGGYGNEPNGVPYQLFSADLSKGLVLNGSHCRGEGESCPVPSPPLAGTEAPAGYLDYYLRDNESASFQALLTGSNLGELTLGPESFDVSLVGANPDLGQILLSTCAALTADATEVPDGEGCDSTSPNLYEWSEGVLSLINLPPGQSEGTPGARLAAQSGAISADGSRVYWVDQATGNLYLREGGQTLWVDESVGGGGTFQTASTDGSVTFFTKAGHLYRYVVATEEATDLTPGGEAQGVLGASADGSSVYYLTTSGLFLWRGGETIAVAPAADPGDYPPTIGTARVSPDGAHLAFLSKTSLTGYDNTDQQTGKPDDEVYLYTAPAGGGEGTLLCASCNPTGERALGPSSIPGAIANGKAPEATDSYKPRALSADGRRLYFDSADSLLPFDTNAATDVYEWEAGGVGSCKAPAGCLYLISSGKSPAGASFVDASAAGSGAFFLTDGSLVPSDPGSVDLYDAREGGGFPEPAPAIPCTSDECTPLPSPPEDPTPGTLVPAPANPPVHFEKPPRTKPHHHHKRRHGKKRHLQRGQQ